MIWKAILQRSLLVVTEKLLHERGFSKLKASRTKIEKNNDKKITNRRIFTKFCVICFCYCLFMEFSLSCNGFNNEAKYFLKWPQLEIVNLFLPGNSFLNDEP